MIQQQTIKITEWISLEWEKNIVRGLDDIAYLSVTVHFQISNKNCFMRS
jgi:hypothetical protein